MRAAATLLLMSLLAVGTACRGCKGCEEEEEQEERDTQRDHFWRAQIAIQGQGTVKTFVDAYDCTSDGTTQRGECGPKLVVFKELKPPTMEAHPAPGWRFERWESTIRERDGSAHPRAGAMPDGRVYLNGFGYSDTGELETVTAVFVPEPG
ncbi:MAG TPA: hypothetical protein VIF15_18220 [Polyangiaceae bacterium]|jgi:hypothetical protein